MGGRVRAGGLGSRIKGPAPATAAAAAGNPDDNQQAKTRAPMQLMICLVNPSLQPSCSCHTFDV